MLTKGVAADGVGTRGGSPEGCGGGFDGEISALSCVCGLLVDVVAVDGLGLGECCVVVAAVED